MFQLTLIRTAMCGLALCATLTAADNLMPEGSIADGGGQPRGWIVPAGQPEWMRSRFSVITEDGRSFVRCENAPAMIEVVKPIDATAVRTVTVTYAFRLAGFQQGANVWDVPFLELNFRDQAGKALVNHTAQQWESKDTAEWTKRTYAANVPVGAVAMFVNLGYKAAAGKADWADIVITAGK